MPQMADITIKKNDGTTNVTFNQQTASGGDNSPARWAQVAAADTVAKRPKALLVTRPNGRNNGRVCVLSGIFPYYDANGDYVGSIPGKLEMTIAENIPQGFIDEAVSQFMNMASSTLVKDSFKTGYAPT